ncbi:hypothetical protein ADU37_CDS19470 [Thermococcus sp. 2319x1]|uniref:hypothetical protein n=1 Tax=Thermococcus sp. 2319x1 TaxID=1674923 RepID=UPI00073AC442|nr:hypothetical protein [Thermococcus sp. 2319x1]ALV63646.1 hypothetical protein ADU37_CDS19470 [Thermococcus sp. 2319x1]
MKKEDLIKEAYRFGYFVGYKGHTEWVSWIAGKKGEIYRQAEELGIYKEVKAAYERGLQDGKERRMKEVALGLGKLEDEILPEKVKTENLQREEEIEIEFSRFSKTPKIVEPPEILALMKAVETPKILSPPKMISKEE